MTVPSIQAQLVGAADHLWQSVSELAITVHEDRPVASDLAAVDDLAERVSELQADVAAARGLLRDDDPVMPRLAELAAHLYAAHLRYWRDLRSFSAVSALRGAARRRGGELPGWQNSVEAGAARCEEPFAVVISTLNAWWQEICQHSMSGRSS
jgi:hypothetical protein